MHQFLRDAPLELTVHPEPPLLDRSGPPLSQGFLFTLIGMAAVGHCSPETLDALSAIEPESWYHGQLLEAILDEAARRNGDAPFQLGRAVYFMLRPQLRQFGITSPERFFATLPGLWTQVTRGDSGWFRAEMSSPQAARVEMAQPYNCRFEEGAIVGFLDGLGCTEVRTQHTRCLREGAPFCVVEVGYKLPEQAP
jgi:predicted hydrocarbon binding protein